LRNVECGRSTGAGAGMSWLKRRAKEAANVWPGYANCDACAEVYHAACERHRAEATEAMARDFASRVAAQLIVNMEICQSSHFALIEYGSAIAEAIAAAENGK